ncbi:MAG: response regulator, partial [Elusimicrobiota bacterium]
MPKRILVADDVESLRKAVARFLGVEGFETLLAADGSDALLIASESRPDLIVVDAMMPGLTGHEVCRILKKKRETRSRARKKNCARSG